MGYWGNLFTNSWLTELFGVSVPDVATAGGAVADPDSSDDNSGDGTSDGVVWVIAAVFVILILILAL